MISIWIWLVWIDWCICIWTWNCKTRGIRRAYRRIRGWNCRTRGIRRAYRRIWGWNCRTRGIRRVYRRIWGWNCRTRGIRRVYRRIWDWSCRACWSICLRSCKLWISVFLFILNYLFVVVLYYIFCININTPFSLRILIFIFIIKIFE